MGEMASLLSEVAEALTYYPGELRIGHGEEGSSDVLAPNASMIIDAREWPSIQEIERMVANWRELTAMIAGPHETSTSARRVKG